MRKMIDNVEGYLCQKIEEKVFPGCTVGVVTNNMEWCKGFGRLTYDADSPEVERDTFYDCASLTKAIPVSCLALKMVEMKIWTNDTLLIEYVPEFIGSYREEISIRHLLTHTIDFGFALSAIKDKGRDAIVAALLNAQLKSLPGTKFTYANATSILLGWAIENCLGMNIAEAAETYFFKPLGMTNATFNPDKLSDKKVAPTEMDPWRKRMVCKEVHDESAYALRPQIVGSAGLFSTITDIVSFVKMLLNEGCHGNMQIFTHDTIMKMQYNAISPDIGCTGLGWELDQPFMGELRNRNTFGKTGFTGCSITIDPDRKKGVVLLSNHTFPERRADRSLIGKVRSELADIVFSS